MQYFENIYKTLPINGIQARGISDPLFQDLPELQNRLEASAQEVLAAPKNLSSSIKLSTLVLRQPGDDDTYEYTKIFNQVENLNYYISKIREKKFIGGDAFWILTNFVGLNQEQQIGNMILNPAAELYKWIRSGRNTPQTRENFIKLIEQRAINSFLSRDALTQYPDRARMYRELSKEIKTSLKNAYKLSLTFVDLGFVNYFNKEGSRRTGDRAIVRAFNQLESCVPQLSEDTQIYRYAGDEIVISSTTNIKQLEKLFANLNRNGIAIQPTKDASPQYIPVPIQYNFGCIDIYTAEEYIEQNMQESRIRGQFSAREFEQIQVVLNSRKTIKWLDTIQNFDISEYYKNPQYARNIRIALEQLRDTLFTPDSHTQDQGDFLSYIIEQTQWQNINDAIPKLIEARTIIQDRYKQEIISKNIEVLSTIPEDVLDAYSELVMNQMILLADEASLQEKVKSRFELIFERYQALSHIEDTESEAHQLLKYLMTYSSKSLKGLNITDLKLIAERYTQDNSKSPWEYYLEIRHSIN